MVRHSTSSHLPCRIRQSRTSGAGPRGGLCFLWPAVTLPRPGLAEGPLPLQRGRVKGTPTAYEHSGFTKPAARTRPCALLVCECASSPNPSSACVRVCVCVWVGVCEFTKSLVCACACACVRCVCAFALRSRTRERAAAIDETYRWVCLPTQPRECSLAPLQQQPGCECISLDRAPLTGA